MMMIEGTFQQALIKLLILTLFPCTSLAHHLRNPVISIIIDDMGYQGIHDINALKLPGPVTYAIMPKAPYSLKISEIASESDKRILLHLPMEALEHEKNKYLGPGALKSEMSEQQFIATLSNNIQSVPNIIGVNNHMGSLLTRQSEQMKWLMGFLHLHNIFYLDSLTISDTAASTAAREKQVPYLKRDVFLDNDRRAEYINGQFEELIRLARRNGSAIAIGHPHPETIEFLMDRLDRLDEYGVDLIAIDEMLDARHIIRTARLSLLH